MTVGTRVLRGKAERVRLSQRRVPVGRQLVTMALAMQVLACIMAPLYIYGAHQGATNDIRRHGLPVTGTVTSVARGYLEVDYVLDGGRQHDDVSCGLTGCWSYDKGSDVRLRVDPVDHGRAVLAESPYTPAG